MKKRLLILSFLLFLTLAACTPEEGTQCADNETLQEGECVRVYTDDEQLILAEMEASFNFFWEQANTNEATGGYGLINDRYPRSTDLASIASVGFGLAAIPIGVEYGWITYEEGEERVLKTLETFENLDHFEGFYYHFLSKTTGNRAGSSEVSVIDTALFIAGAITAGEYFGGDAKFKATTLYARIDWNWYINPRSNQFYMGYDPEDGFVGAWDFYAEQLLLYVLGAGAPLDDHRIDPIVYYSFDRHVSSYGDGEPFIHSWFGSIFTYQFSHSFIDFRNTEDSQGVNWFDNSIHATLANRQYAIDNPNDFITFGENAWGMTAADGPSGYSGKYGAPPSGRNTTMYLNDGTIPPAGALGSIVFTPEESIAALRYFDTIEGLQGDYGHQDSFNFDAGDPWIANDVIGIDKGVTVLMLSNYMDETTWTYFMQNQYIQDGMELLEIEPIED